MTSEQRHIDYGKGSGSSGPELGAGPRHRMCWLQAGWLYLPAVETCTLASAGKLLRVGREPALGEKAWHRRCVFPECPHRRGHPDHVPSRWLCSVLYRGEEGRGRAASCQHQGWAPRLGRAGGSPLWREPCCPGTLEEESTPFLCSELCGIVTCSKLNRQAMGRQNMVRSPPQGCALEPPLPAG